MQVLNTTLVLGPYDWDPAVLPAAEFEARVAAARKVLAAQGASTDPAGLVVYGDTFDHGALSYLTGFTPKLGPAFAFFPAEGEPSILFAGGAMIVEAAKKLTWVADVRAIRDLEKDLAGQMNAIAGRQTAAATSAAASRGWGLWQTGRMSQAAYQALLRAMGPAGRMVDVQLPLENLRRCKSLAEAGALRRAGSILGAAVERLRCEAFAPATATAALAGGPLAVGKGARSTALAAERAAYSQGAQDARVLASARNGGPPLPFDNAEDACRDPLLAAVAVRYAGYWAEAYVTLGSRAAPVRQQAEGALRAMISAARPGATVASLGAVVDRALQPVKRNPDEDLVTGVGLSLTEAPYGLPEARLEEGDVCCLKVDAIDPDAAQAADGRAITSAMVMMRAGGAEVLWSEAAV